MAIAEIISEQQSTIDSAEYYVSELENNLNTLNEIHSNLGTTINYIETSVRELRYKIDTLKELIKEGED